MSIDEFRLLAGSAHLADDCGPLVSIDDLDQTDDVLLRDLRQLLGAEPCIVLGLDVHAATAEERATIEATIAYLRKVRTGPLSFRPFGDYLADRRKSRVSARH